VLQDFFSPSRSRVLPEARWARNTAYALTDRRVLMTVGPRRQDIRSLPLTELGRVRIVPNRRLLLSWRLPGQAPLGPRSIWTNPNNGKIDRWAPPYWRVSDPAAVQEMLESARNAVWYTSASASPFDFEAPLGTDEGLTAE
jgi:hypothetical protein